MEDTLRVTNQDGRQFIRDAALEAYTRTFAPVLPPAPKQPKTSRKTPSTSAPASSTPAFPTAKSAPPPPAKPIECPTFIDHFVMNLPGSALDEFVDAFRGCYNGLEGKVEKEDVPMPMVHVHCFTPFEGEEAEEDIAKVRPCSLLRFSFPRVREDLTASCRSV